MSKSHSEQNTAALPKWRAVIKRAGPTEKNFADGSALP